MFEHMEQKSLLQILLGEEISFHKPTKTTINETDTSEFGSFFEVCFIKLVFSPTRYFQLSTFLPVFISCQHHDISAMNQGHAVVMIRKSSARKVPVLQGLGSYHLRTCGLMVETSLLQWLTEKKMIWQLKTPGENIVLSWMHFLLFEL